VTTLLTVSKASISPSDLAFPEVGRGALHPQGDLLPPAGGRVDGGGDGHVIPMGVKCLHVFGIPLAELAHRLLATFDHCVEVLYGSHLGITSIVPTPFP
jgi:hypothetical protein